MLKILTGPDRITLTQRIMGQIHEKAKAGQAGQILIVPEQFSHEAERRLCACCGDTISRFAEVLSFSRLADRVASCHGGVARAYLDRGGQLLSMALAAEQTGSQLKLFAPVLRKPDFLANLVRMTTEFQSYCLTPQQLMDASREETGLFSEKLRELAILYEGYLAVCANGKADPSNKLVHLTDALLEGSWPKGKLFYLDGFSDFTGAELVAVEALLLHGEEVTITLCAGEPDTVMEQLCDDTIRLLLRTAGQVGVPACVQTEEHYGHRNQDVTLLLQRLFTAKTLPPRQSNAVALCAYPSVEEECRGVVAEIKSLVAQGTRCREISVACTDSGVYEAPLTAAFRAAKLPVYVAGETDLLSKPLIGAVLHALEAATGPMEYESVALYLKSGLPLLERDRCDRLDNYAYLWNLRGTLWEKTWDMHPVGFGEGWSEKDRQTLARLNEDKTAALEPLFSLRRALLAAGNTGEMVRALYQFLEELQLRQRLEQQANEFAGLGDGQMAQELVQLHEILCNAMEQIWLTLGETIRSAEEFSHLFRSLLTQYRVGTIPAGLDQVQVSSLPDLRYRTTGYLFVLGAGDGAFPAYQTADGLLTEEERQRLLNIGLHLAPGRADQMNQEMGRIYGALQSACERIALSYAGEQPSWLFRRAVELYPQSLRQCTEEVFLRMEDFAAWRLRRGDKTPMELPGLSQIEETLSQRRDYGFTDLSGNTVQQLYGTPLQLSASKIDSYASCRLQYFLRYGLRARPRKQAKLDQPAFGTFVHAVLEHTVRRVMKLGGFDAVSEDTVLNIASEELHVYAREYLPEQGERDTWLLGRSEKEILEIVRDLWEELRVSQFRPAFCELKFARDGALPMITIQGKQMDCQVMGLVDRVDLFSHDGKNYVRIVDYKTGTKNFDYTDILNGTGLQMLIYLFALRAFGGEYLGTGPLEPAGVLYLPARTQYPLTEPLPSEAEVEKEHRQLRKRKGLIRQEDFLLQAMEEDPELPKYMPYQVGRNGRSGDLADRRQMQLLERHVIRTVADLADRMAQGGVSPDPVVRGQNSPCRYCDYVAVCHPDLGLRQPREQAETKAGEFWARLEMEEENHG